ncbi:sensor histidine kinase [Paenibacillus sp. GCM10027627]|uniref:sensor histidine kinase n=1 Tax=unclassified Paenibacillus TaxID=185978 RepID=UPI0036407C9D
MWLQIVVIMLLLSVSAFHLQYFRLLREIKRLARTTEEIRSGNLNLRYRLLASRKPVEKLSGELNRLLDHFQTTFERTRFLEEERKRMIASISHDLRTPLTSLLGYMEVLQSDPSLTATERSDFIRIAADKGNVLSERLQEFFELANSESDDSQAELHSVNLTQVVQEVLVGFYPAFQNAEITPVVEISCSPRYVMAEPSCLRRVLENLMTNAFRYGSGGGEIGIVFRDETDWVWVDLWDRGAGITSQDLPRVFERFYTGEASRNASIRGTGLGLTITKNLIEKQGGRISVSSVPGEKTTFSFSLKKA